MRTKRHLFPPGEELVFIDGQLHTDESYTRRYHQHRFKDHYLILDADVSEERLIHLFANYDPGKWQISEEKGAIGADIEARLFVSLDFYQPRWKTGLGMGGNETWTINQMKAIRENPLIWIAEGWQPSVMFPSGELEKDEKI